MTLYPVSLFMRMSAALLGRLSTPRLESLLHGLIAGRAGRMPADEALRFLFRIEAGMYELEGCKAVEYGGGIHTKHRHTRYHDFFVDSVKAGERVLDIGCGNGALTYDVAERAGAFVVGIDKNPENISLARARHPHPRIEYMVGDARGPLPGSPFDAVVLSNVLEHLAGRVDFLRDVIRTARPSRLLIRVPMFNRDWRAPLKRELGVEWRLDPTHETEYTPESFKEELSEAGLKVVRSEIAWGEIWAEAAPDVT